MMLASGTCGSESTCPRGVWPHPSGQPQVSGTRIMVVDDEADVRDLLTDYLGEEGYTVQAFGNATDALLKLDEVRPRVILLDILMPGLSGVSALERVRATNPEVGVVMVTGNDDGDIARQTLALGAFEYVTKPIDFDHLKRVLDTFLLLQSA